MTTRGTPHDLDAERAILGAILIDDSCFDDLVDLVDPMDFYAVANAATFMAMLRIHRRSERIDLVSLRAELTATGDLERAGGDEALLRLSAELPRPESIEVYARIVRDHATLRALVSAAHSTIARVQQPIESVEQVLDEAEAALSSVSAARRSARSMLSIGDVMSDVVRDLGERAERADRGEVTGVPTGFPALDRMLAGLQPGQFVVAAGRTGMGKSAFGAALTLNAARVGVSTAVFTLEMTPREWGQRFLVSEARVLGDDARSGRLDVGDWKRIQPAAARIAALPIHIDGTPSITLWQLRSHARRLRARHGLGLVVIDYLQLMRSGERFDRDEAEIAAVSKGLKALAKELEIPIVALAQLSRETEKRSDRRPQISDLRNSGQIEQDADVIAFLFRPGYYDRKADPTAAEIIVAKQRGGPTGVVRATFLAHYTRFEEHDPNEFQDGQRKLGGL